VVAVETATPLLALACALAVALSVCSIVWVTVFSKPARLVQLERSCEALRTEWTAKRLELDGVLDAIDGQLESVERKRRQVAGAVSRLPGAEPAQPPSRAELLAPYRRAAFGGGSE